MKTVSIQGYEKLYSIREDGCVISLPKTINYVSHGSRRTRTTKEKILKGGSADGYMFVTLCKNGEHTNHYVHRLVATAFIANPDGKRTVNHKNGIKSDNRADNLEWATHAENNYHAFNSGLNNKNKPRKIGMFNKKGEMVAQYDSVHSVKKDGMQPSVVFKVCNNEANTHNGHTFKFL